MGKDSSYVHTYIRAYISKGGSLQEMPSAAGEGGTDELFISPPFPPEAGS